MPYFSQDHVACLVICRIPNPYAYPFHNLNYGYTKRNQHFSHLSDLLLEDQYDLRQMRDLEWIRKLLGIRQTVKEIIRKKVSFTCNL